MAYGKAFRVVVALMGIMALAHTLNILSGFSLNAYGIQPRTISGLAGIAASPFLHSSLPHLIGNLIPFAVLSAIVLLGGLSRYLTVSILVVGIGGTLVWLFGRDANHVGASGWIFGLWSFVIGQAWFSRSWKHLIAAAAVLAIYSGMIFGFLPRYGVSFESHIAGAIAGWLAAWILQFSPQLGADRQLNRPLHK